MSSENDHDRTMLVKPAVAASAAPNDEQAPLAAVSEDVSDKTVIMKPSQRAREAAAALSVERKRSAELARPAAPETVDFDVTQGGDMRDIRPSAPPAAGVMPYLVGAAVVAVVGLVALFLL